MATVTNTEIFSMLGDQLQQLRRYDRERLFYHIKTTSSSTIFDISMRLLREDQKHRHRDGNYSFVFCPLHAAHA